MSLGGNEKSRRYSGASGCHTVSTTDRLNPFCQLVVLGFELMNHPIVIA
jgi:hypothetical protein